MNNIEVRFSEEAELVFQKLKAGKSKKENALLRSIRNKIELVRQNPHYGNPIAKRLIPNEYVIKFDIHNLFRVELPFFWRMLYSITNNNIQIIALVVDLIDHKDYDKKFRYKKN